MNKKDDSHTHLPLRETTYFILLALTDEPRHGYGIMKEVRRISQERIKLSSGTLYGALKRLLDQGWIMLLELEKPEGSIRERKFYQISDLGRSVLESEIARLNGLVAAARNQLAGGKNSGVQAPA